MLWCRMLNKKSIFPFRIIYFIHFSQYVASRSSALHCIQNIVLLGIFFTVCIAAANKHL